MPNIGSHESTIRRYFAHQAKALLNFSDISQSLVSLIPMQRRKDNAVLSTLIEDGDWTAELARSNAARARSHAGSENKLFMLEPLSN